MFWTNLKFILLTCVLIAVDIVFVCGVFVLFGNVVRSNTTETITQGYVVGKIETGTIEEPAYSLKEEGKYTMPILGIPMTDVELEGVHEIEVTKEVFDCYALGDWYAMDT